MSLEDGEEHEVTWLVEEEEGGGQPVVPELSPQQRVAQLEVELQAQRKELVDVRKELAAKTVQLMRKEQATANSQQQQQPVAPPLASPSGSGSSSELERQLHQLAGQVHQLQVTLAQREEELDEARRLAASQKRALREAAAQQGERELAERAAVEASRAVAGAAVEEELERLTAELAAVKTRSELELQARDAEVKGLTAELSAIHARHKEALAASEAALTEAWQAELNTVQGTLGQRLEQYEEEVARLRNQLADARNHADSSTLISELAMLNNQKVQVQREFEAFRDMATQAARKNREEVARLLEENAALHSRLAAYKTAELVGSSLVGGNGGAAGMGALTAGHSRKVAAADVLADQPPPGVSTSSAYGYLEHHMPQLLSRITRHRTGLVPLLVVGAVLGLILLVTIIRAAASTRSQHGSPLCFLAKLGIRIGTGCEVEGPLPPAAKQGLADLLEHTERIHDVDITKVITLPDDPAAPAVPVDGSSSSSDSGSTSSSSDSGSSSSSSDSGGSGGSDSGPQDGSRAGSSSSIDAPPGSQDGSAGSGGAGRAGDTTDSSSSQHGSDGSRDGAAAGSDSQSSSSSGTSSTAGGENPRQLAPGPAEGHGGAHTAQGVTVVGSGTAVSGEQTAGMRQGEQPASMGQGQEVLPAAAGDSASSSSSSAIGGAAAPVAGKQGGKRKKRDRGGAAGRQPGGGGSQQPGPGLAQEQQQPPLLVGPNQQQGPTNGAGAVLRRRGLAGWRHRLP